MALDIGLLVPPPFRGLLYLKMSDQLRYIVDTLHREPYNKSYTIISFDSLDPLSLLQVVNDVIAEIDPEQKLDLRDEPAEQTALRLLGTLKILNYKPKEDVGQGMNTFRQGLIQGEKLTVYPLLSWLLQRMPELKKRAYLARFLVKIEVPVEYLQDETLEETYQTYASMIEHFKELHKAVEFERSSEYNTSDVRRDIEAMEEEKKQLSRQLERLKRRVEMYPRHEEILDSARKLRKEKEKGDDLKKQKEEQRNQLNQVKEKEAKLMRELEETKEMSSGLTAELVLSKAKEDNNLLCMLTSDNLPKKIEAKRRECIEMEKVVSEPVVSELDLEVIQQQIDEVNDEIRSLIDKKMSEDDSGIENLALFRQQASLIAHKRQVAAETIENLMEELEVIKEEEKEKERQLEEMGGIKLIKEDEFRKYIEHLRVISTIYKQKKGEMSALRAEFGVLSRTEEILKSKDENVQDLLSFMEKKKGVSGYKTTQDDLEQASNLKSELDTKKEKTLQEMSVSVQTLKDVIEEKKSVLAPLIKAVRPLRQKHQDVKSVHREKKATYDSTAAGLQSKRSQLDKEVQGLWNDCIAEESQYHLLSCELEAVRLHDQRVKAEMKAVVSKDPTEKKKSLRDQLTRKIHEQENLGRALRDKQKDLKETHKFAVKQVKMWHDLEKLFSIKKRCFSEAQEQKQRTKDLQELSTTDGRIQIMN